MTFPRRYLAEGEQIIVERGLHPIRLGRTILVVIALFSGCGAAVLIWKSAPRWFGIVVGVIFLYALSYLFIKVMVFRSTQFVLTTRRVIYRSGVLRRTSREIPLGSIQEVATIRSFFRRVIGVGDLRVSAVGDRDVEPFYDLRHPEQLEPLIHKAMENRHREELREAMEPEPEYDPYEEYERMVNLHRKGVITSNELEAHRRSLGFNGAKDS